MAAKPEINHLLFLLILFSAFLWKPSTAEHVLYSCCPLYTGQSLQNRNYVLTMEPNCDVVLYDNGTPVWSTGTSGRGTNCRLAIGGDGNIAVYTGAGAAVWSTGTVRPAGHYVLVLQHDRNLVSYGGSIWNGGVGIPGANGNSNSALVYRPWCKKPY